MTHRSTWITPDQARAALLKGKGRGIKIAVIDSGVELTHPKLNGTALIDDIAFELSEKGIVKRTRGRGIDTYGHGTAVAAIIRRIAPEAQIGSFRVLDHENRSKFVIIEEGARMAIERGYHILNCSFGAVAKWESIVHFKPWVDAAYRRGVHIVSACSNRRFRDPEWPGNFPTVITVNMARHGEDDLFFRWDAMEGKSARHLVEFAAPGVDLDVAWMGGAFKKETGSSFAAPHATGLLARLLSVYPQLKPPVAKALLQEVALPWDISKRAPNG